jgi:hypothetical protein
VIVGTWKVLINVYCYCFVNPSQFCGLIPFTPKLYKPFQPCPRCTAPSRPLIGMDASGNNLAHMNDYELRDFVDESNFIHCINLIRGEGGDPVVNYGTDDLVNGCFVDAQFDPIPIPIPEDIYSFNATTMVSDPNSVFNSLPSFGGEEEDIDGEDSSATTTTTTTTNTTPTKKEKVDRSRTLISERRRRGRMKEKLYALRSLVPNITKVCLSILFMSILLPMFMIKNFA